MFGRTTFNGELGGLQSMMSWLVVWAGFNQWWVECLGGLQSMVSCVFGRATFNGELGVGRVPWYYDESSERLTWLPFDDFVLQVFSSWFANFAHFHAGQHCSYVKPRLYVSIITKEWNFANVFILFSFFIQSFIFNQKMNFNSLITKMLL